VAVRDKNSSYEVDFLIKEISEELDEGKKKTKIKNRRYAAMKSLGEEDFFSHQEMRRRNPLLYSDLVESHMTEEEISARRSKETEEEKKREEDIKRRELEERIREKELLKRIEKEENGEVAPVGEDGLSAEASLDMQSISSSLPSTSNSGVDNTTLSQYLLKCYDEKETNKFRDFQKGGEEEVEEEEEEEEDEDEEEGEGKEASGDGALTELPEAEKSLLESEFEWRMREQFLDGGDALFGVNYQQIDEDEKLDDLETINRDAEDKWFEQEEEDDDEEEAMNDLSDADELNFRPRRVDAQKDAAMDDDDEVDYLDFALDQC